MQSVTIKPTKLACSEIDMLAVVKFIWGEYFAFYVNIVKLPEQTTRRGPCLKRRVILIQGQYPSFTSFNAYMLMRTILNIVLIKNF